MSLSSQTTVSGTLFKSVFTSGTESAPSAVTDGQAVTGFSSIVVELEADSGQTLSGAGTLLCYLYDAVSGGPGAYMPLPSGNLSVPSSAASSRRCVLEVVELSAPFLDARLMWIPSGVTLSGGGLTVYQHGFRPEDLYAR